MLSKSRQDTPETIEDIAFVLEYLPVLEGKDLMLKTAHTSIIRHEELKLVPIWKFPSHWLVFMVSEAASRKTSKIERNKIKHKAKSQS